MYRTKMYVCFAFFPDGSVKRWKYVRNLKSFSDFLSKSHPAWKYFNVYDKGTKAFVKRFYPGNQIPKVICSFIMLAFFLFNIPSSINTYENTFDKTTLINGFNNSATISTLMSEKGGSLWHS